MGGRLPLARKHSLLVSILVLLFIALTLHRHDSQRDHYLSEYDATKPASDGPSTLNQWKTPCRQHGFSAYPRSRKIYDLVLFSTELDWLEIRLHTHSPYVDYFVIIESPTTFTGKAKPLTLKENWNRFKNFHHKIIYRTVEDTVVSERHWDHEDFQRNALLREVFPGVDVSHAAEKGDVLIVSDMDELLKPDALQLLRHCDFPRRLTLRSDFYYFSFQWLHRGEQWAHPQATTFGSSVADTLAPNDLRMNLMSPGLAPLASLARWWDTATLWNAGWHCSSCFSTIKEMQTKMHSFSHQGWNTAENRDAETMLHRVRNGLDLFGRVGEEYDRITSNQDVPRYILDAYETQGKFKYLLNRDGQDAGFEDWTES